MKTVLLTGAAGFLGTQIARRLLKEPDLGLVALVRAENPQAALGRLSGAWFDWPELAASIGGRVQVVAGDVALPRLGLGDAVYADLTHRITHIIHTAADLRLNAPIEELRATNVQGTAKVLELARVAHRDHGLSRLAHISTAYVAGGRSGTVQEDALSDESGFFSAYELSKYEGERLVQAAKSEFPVSVFRPGMIVGDSGSGAIKTFNTFYFPLRLYLSGKLWVIPASPALRLNIVPVDYVAEAVARLTLEPQAAGLNFHLTAPPEALFTVGQLVTFTQEWAREHLDLKLSRPLFLPLPRFLTQRKYRPGQASGGSEALGGPIRDLLPYFSENRRFSRDNLDRLLGPYPLDWHTFLPKLIEYALYYGFLHRSERTVHQQLLYRLEGHGPSVTYHDLAQGKMVTRSGSEVRQDMLKAASALQALGIGKGDRVALVGHNSSRYLTLDAAIGLAGAVSVPLYYTSPPADLEAILGASGAKLLLVGTPKLLERIGEFAQDLPTVSFCRELPPNLPKTVLSWDTFLALGVDKGLHVPLGLGDLATLRYTSGTTGRPKGVTFSHAHLRWMGESMASLLPWKARIRPVRHLSFLPMNHVVEGILATYSPYYLPARVDIYFLEDFRQLENALPRVRPTLFFSVPRFYEKVWEALLKNPLGQWYLRLPEGLLRRLLRPLLRRVLLRKAGLERCHQLVVGSAPAEDELLQNYRQLGIEIHDAYGLTEAPLVSLNRLGANRIGSVGQPLPQTELRIAEDGEILVRGPQVTSGYFGEGIEQPFREGWLLSGDLGSLNDGYLVIEGRKKELIATAYGKKVQPSKVEELLKEIPGVAEAMLLGENRPYCVALLWLEENHPPLETLDRGLQEVNSRLSHPEQAKRWAILPNDLSIEGGDLTANLKLKRKAVGQRFQGVIEALYGGATSLQGVLHIGWAEREEPAPGWAEERV